MNRIKKKLRKEKSNQLSGRVKLSALKSLKERHYFPVEIPLDGDQPKEYIKAYFYHKNCPKASRPKSWEGYFAKFGGKSYPHESIVEYVINKIGECLGLKMNETELVVINEQVRFLSKDFLRKGQKLVHGIEILAEYLEDRQFVDEINEDRKNRRSFLTFDVIEKAVKYVYPDAYGHIINGLIKLITFDAIVGNNDRHFYNWGVIDNVEKISGAEVMFSPAYDSARALLWNKTDDSLVLMYRQHLNGDKRLDSFIKKSKPRFSFQENPKADHFELLEYLSNYNDVYKEIISNLISEEIENEVLEALKKETYFLFCKERCILMQAILKKRFARLRESINL